MVTAGHVYDTIWPPCPAAEPLVCSRWRPLAGQSAGQVTLVSGPSHTPSPQQCCVAPFATVPAGHVAAAPPPPS